MMNKTILHVPRRFVAEEWGGTETVIAEIARQQRRAGFQPKIVTSMALASERRETIGGIPVERYPYCYPFAGLAAEDKAALDKKGGNLLSLSLIWGLLREPNVRLFHAHSLKRLGGSVSTAARLRNKPFVVSLHGGVFDVPVSEVAAMREPTRGKFEWGRAFGQLLRSRQVLDDADVVICVGQGEYEAAKRKLSHGRVTYLPNGVDSAKFRRGNGARFRMQHGIGPSEFVVLNISRIDEQKNQLALVDAFAVLHEQNPDSRLILIGPETRPQYAEKIRQRIRDRNLQHAATILAGLRHDDPALLDAYHSCDVFVLPSIHEPFGIVVLEAWSAGKPVIASSVGGLKGLINHQQNGLLFDPTAASATYDLAGEMLRLSRNSDARARLAEQGRREAVGRYDWIKIHSRQENIYRWAEEHRRCRHSEERGQPDMGALAAFSR